MNFGFLNKLLIPILFSVFFVAGISPATVFSATGAPNIFSYQGRLTNSDGILLGGAGTNYYFRFSLWDNSTVGSGSRLWPTATPGTTMLNVVDGVFNVGIGDTSNGYPDALTYNFQDNSQTYLQVEVSTDGVTFETLNPRQAVNSAGFAINSNTLAGLVPGVGANNLLKLGNDGEINIAGAITASNVSGTNTGDITLSDASGLSLTNQVLSIDPLYTIPLIASTTAWQTAYSWGDHSTAGYLTDVATTTVQGMFSSGAGLSYSAGTFANTGVLSIGGLTGDVATSSLGLLTTDIVEGSNFYYTDSRARGAFSSSIAGLTYTNSTGDFSLASGYDIPLSASTTDWQTAYSWGNHAAAGYIQNISTFTTDNLTQGSSNLYFSNALADARIASATSTIQNMFANGTGLSYSAGVFANTGVLSIGGLTGDVATSSLSFLTTNINEGDNLYYTDARARNALSSSATGLTYASATGDFSLTSGYSIPLLASTTDWQTAYSWGDHSTAGYLTDVATTTVQGMFSSGAGLSYSAGTFANTGVLSIGGLTGDIATSSLGITSSQWTTNGTSVYYNDGNVGIGTTNPISKMDVLVSGAALTNADYVGTAGNFEGPTPTGQSSTLSIVSNSTVAADAGGVLGFGGNYDGSRYANWASIKGLKEDGTSGNYGGYLSFFTRLNGAGSAERMRIDTAGNVGIGTTTPRQPLHITKTTSGSGGVMINSTNAGGYAELMFSNNTYDPIGDFVFGYGGSGTSNADQGYFWNRRNGDILFGTNATERMRIVGGGNVGIGTITPTSLLSEKSALALESGVLGPELLNSGGWTSAGWTGTDPFTHTVGNTTALSNTRAAVTAVLYHITYTITGRTAGTVAIAFGGQSINVSATGAWGPRATNGATFVATPSSTFDGTVTFSVKAVTAYGSTFDIQDNTGASNFEIRSSLASLNNTFVGKSAGSSNTSGGSNTAVGVSALEFNTTGAQNTALGQLSLRSNTVGVSNMAFGYRALFNNTTGGYNSGIGLQSLFYNTTGSNNTGNGSQSLQNNSVGSGNTGIGAVALVNNTTGSNNVAIGTSAGFYQADGTTNLTVANNSIYIGAETRGFNNSDNNSIVIGYRAIGLGANSVVLGSSTITRTVLQGNIGIGSTTPAYKLTVSGTVGMSGLSTDATVGLAGALCLDANDQLVKMSGSGTCVTSSERYKTDIVALDHGLDWVKSLRPVTFNYKSNGAPSLGLIAEEVDKISPLLTARNDDGQLNTVRYELLPAVIVKAIQELNAKVDAIGTSTVSTQSIVGASVVDGLLGWVGHKITAVYGYFTEITADKVKVNKGLEMTDQDTGDVYCVVVKSGEFVKTKGECQAPVVINNTSSGASVSTTTASGVVSDTIASTTDAVASTTESVVETPAPEVIPPAEPITPIEIIPEPAPTESVTPTAQEPVIETPAQ